MLFDANDLKGVVLGKGNWDKLSKNVVTEKPAPEGGGLGPGDAFREAMDAIRKPRKPDSSGDESSDSDSEDW